MCGIFGFSSAESNNYNNLTELLSKESALRGTDACGVAFNTNRLNILKEGKSAYTVKFKLPEIKVVMGHTRHTTQGNEKQNFNNHPFFGRTKKGMFALAHNGVITNEDVLRSKYHLSETRIKTDSYIAVQLLEYKNKINMDSLRFMAEELGGSFAISVLDDKNNLYIVKGDNPVSILYFPKQRIYVYASTDSILWKAVIESNLMSAMKNGDFKEIPIDCGEILKICNNGKLERGRFKYDGYGFYRYENYLYSQSDYISCLKEVAEYNGFRPDDVDILMLDGFTFDEIEEYIYGGLEV